MFRFMLNQWISWNACVSTKITRNGDASDVISFNVFNYSIHTSLLSTHLASSCSSPAVRIFIVTGFHHWLHLLAQNLKVCVISCVICECSSWFKCVLQIPCFIWSILETLRILFWFFFWCLLCRWVQTLKVCVFSCERCFKCVSQNLCFNLNILETLRILFWCCFCWKTLWNSLLCCGRTFLWGLLLCLVSLVVWRQMPKFIL